MANSFELSLLNIKGAAKAVEKLIDVVSGAIGRLYTPVDKIFNAHADAKSLQIMARAKHAEFALTDRSAMRLAHIEGRRQVNIDAIVTNAAELLPVQVSDANVDADWAAAFFESCKDIGGVEMRQIWARILSGEVAQPGTFSRRTLSIVQSMSTDDAKSFTRLCSVAFKYSETAYGFFMPAHHVFEHIREYLLTTDEEVHLQNIGLLSSSKIYLYHNDHRCDVQYFLRPYTLMPKGGLRSKKDVDEANGDPDPDPELFPFTKAGNELAAIAGGTPDKKFVSLWKRHSGFAEEIVLKTRSK